MRPQLILILSLVGNLALGATAYHFFKPKSERVTSSLGDETVDSKTSPVAQKAAGETILVTNILDDNFSWNRVEAADYKAYIANLRSIGCPEQTIRDIIVADVNKLYHTKQKAVTDDDGGYKYWDTEDRSNSKAGREKQKQSQALYKEKSALLVELLGIDPEKERNREMGFDYEDRQLGFLSPEKRVQIQSIRDKFQEEKQDFFRDAIYDADDWRKLRQIEKNEMTSLGSVLTPQELEQYQLHNSQMANQLRHDLDDFDPSEEEFKTVFRLRQARADDLISSNDPDDKETQERYKKAKEDLDKQIKAQLGDARYAEFERSQDYAYKELARLTERLELPKQSASGVYDMKKVAEDQVKKIREDKSLSDDQRNQALQAVRSETENAVTASLGGEKNFSRYKSRGGWWMNNLAPTPRPKTTTTVKP